MTCATRRWRAHHGRQPFIGERRIHACGRDDQKAAALDSDSRGGCTRCSESQSRHALRRLSPHFSAPDAHGMTSHREPGGAAAIPVCHTVIEVNPRRHDTSVGDRGQTLVCRPRCSSHKRPHNRKTGCIPYYIAAAMPQEEEGALENVFTGRCAMCAFGCRKPRNSYPMARRIFASAQDLRHLRGESSRRRPRRLWLNAVRGAQESWVGADADGSSCRPTGQPRVVGCSLDKGCRGNASPRWFVSLRKGGAAALTSTLVKRLRHGPARMLSESDWIHASRRAGRSSNHAHALPAISRNQGTSHSDFRLAGRQEDFCLARRDDRASAWASGRRRTQQLMTLDTRFRIPPYMGHNGDRLGRQRAL